MFTSSKRSQLFQKDLCSIFSFIIFLTAVASCRDANDEPLMRPTKFEKTGETGSLALLDGALAVDPMRDVFSKPKIMFNQSLEMGTNEYEKRGYDANDNVMGVYAYAPNIKVSSYGSAEVYMFYCRYGDANSWDKIMVRKSTNWGINWGPETLVYQASGQMSLDRTACDPDVLQVDTNKFVLFYTGNNRDPALKDGVPDYCTDPSYTNGPIEGNSCGQSAIFYAVSSSITGPYTAPNGKDGLLVTRDAIGSVPTDHPGGGPSPNKYGAGQSSAVVNPDNPNEIWMWYYDDSNLWRNQGGLKRVNLEITKTPSSFSLSVVPGSARDSVDKKENALTGMIAPEVRYNLNTKNLELLYFGSDNGPEDDFRDFGHHGENRILIRSTFDPVRSNSSKDVWSSQASILNLNNYNLKFANNPGVSGTFTGAYDGESYILGFGKTKQSCLAHFPTNPSKQNDCKLKAGDLYILHVRDTLKSVMNLPTLDANFYQPLDSNGNVLVTARGSWTASHTTEWCNFDMGNNISIKDCLFNGLKLKSNQYLLFLDGQLVASVQTTAENAIADCVSKTSIESQSSKRVVECFHNGMRIVGDKYKISYEKFNSFGLLNPSPIIVGEGFSHYRSVVDTCKMLPNTSDQWGGTPQSWALYQERKICTFGRLDVNK